MTRPSEDVGDASGLTAWVSHAEDDEQDLALMCELAEWNLQDPVYGLLVDLDANCENFILTSEAVSSRTKRGAEVSLKKLSAEVKKELLDGLHDTRLFGSRFIPTN